METQIFVEYELCDPVSNRRVITESRDEASAYFEREWLVYENHITIGRPSTFTQAKLVLTTVWNNNPDYYENETDSEE